MEKGEIRINTENIFPIIKKAVYSDHEIFLRELVSNGVDAISNCLLYTSPSPRDTAISRMPSSA